MWIFCHGIATLVANGTVHLTDSQIEELLSYEFQALMLLEENQKTAEVKAMIETYNKMVSFVDFSSLDKIIAKLS